MKRADDQLTRAELAKALRKSKTTIRRWEAEGKLKPTINERGVRLYRVADAKRLDPSAKIETLRQARTHIATVERVSDEVAAEVIDLLEQGVPPATVVVRLRLHPDAVEGLVASWGRLRRAIVLDAKHVRALADAFVMRRLRGADDLVMRLQRFAKEQKRCEDCKQSPPMFCHHCLDKSVEEALAESLIQPPAGREDGAV